MSSVAILSSTFILIHVSVQGAILIDTVHNYHPSLLIRVVSRRLSGKQTAKVTPFSLTRTLQFLYIDLFIIIPIAVTSKLTNRLSLPASDVAFSGTHITIPSHLSQGTHR